MSNTREDELAAKREQEAARRARIKSANERIAALPDAERGKIHDRANTLEVEARRDGSREAHVAFLERALDERPTRKAAPADADDRALDKATQAVAEQVATDLRDRALRLRNGGMTVAEIAGQLEVGAAVVRTLIDDAPRGKGKGKAKKQADAPARKAREVRGSGVDREEKCPGCGEWRNGETNGDGKYVNEADYREGRGDCRACYNRRWREGNERRKALAGQAGK